MNKKLHSAVQLLVLHSPRLAGAHYLHNYELVYYVKLITFSLSHRFSRQSVELFIYYLLRWDVNLRSPGAV